MEGSSGNHVVSSLAACCCLSLYPPFPPTSSSSPLFSYLFPIISSFFLPLLPHPTPLDPTFARKTPFLPCLMFMPAYPPLSPFIMLLFRQYCTVWTQFYVKLSNFKSFKGCHCNTFAALLCSTKLSFKFENILGSCVATRPS